MDNFIQSLKPRIKSLRESLYLIARNKLSLTALIILVLLIVGALLAPYIIPYPEDLADARPGEDGLHQEGVRQGIAHGKSHVRGGGA